MTPRRTIVFFPCHSLDDFPTWLGDSEADELLAAWTAAWHPRLIAAAGRMPAWASVEVPPGNDAEVLGIVTASCDDRLIGRLDPASTPGSRWVRRAGDRATTVGQALAALGLPADPQPFPASAEPPAAATGDAAPADAPTPPPPRQAGVADFHAFGLAWLLSELLARRMRSTTGLGSTAAFTGGPGDEPATGFEERIVAAARAWEAGDATTAGEALSECFGHLEAARARYYAVDVWLIDLVLLAETTLGARLAAELDAPVPLAIVATGRIMEKLSRTDPGLASRLRRACDAGRVAPAGGRYDEEPLDGLLPETIRESFLQGHRAWQQAIGRVPVTFAQFGGGWSAILPQILTHFDYAGVIWNLFDGTPLPDPGLGRIRWEGTGSGCLEGISRPPLDARRAATILNLAERIGDALDNEHTAIIQFAHYAGMASPWFEDLRRIGSWTTALGTFVTPDEHFRRTPGSGKLVTWEPDSYPVARPQADPAAGAVPATEALPPADPIAPRVAAARSEAQRIVAGRKVLAGLPVSAVAAPGPGEKRVIRAAGAPSPAPPPTPAAAVVAKKKPSGGLLGGLTRGLFGGGGDDRLVLENDRLRVRVHPQTGGLLSVRQPEDRGNRLSQHLAMRTTRPPPAVGSAWEDPQERAEYAIATAESVTRTGERTIESRGHCSDPKGHKLFTFTQRIELLDGLPLARLDVEIAIAAPGAGAILERYAACRFAWNENDDLDVVRSLHGQGVVSERTLITAPHFLALRPVHGGGVADVNILTGGLPWHLRASPHILDTLLLAGDATAGKFTLAVGLGLDRPWNAALDLLATGNPPAPLLPVIPSTAAGNVRLSWQGPVLRGGRPIGVRVGLVESEGKGGDVTVDWGFDVAAARVADALGRPGGSPGVTIAGTTTTTYLRRFEWLQLELLFPGQDSAGEWPPEETTRP